MNRKAKLFFIFLFLVGFSFGKELDFGFVKLDVLSFYPAKQSLYEKEPVFLRFDFYIKENRTALPDEVILSFIRVKPVDEKVILHHQETSIHPDEIKLRVKNVVFMEKGLTYMPFEVGFDTGRMRGLVSERALKTFSKKYLLKKDEPVNISPVPGNVPYVGSFKIKTTLKDDGKVATLLIEIKGKGFPHVPNYQVVVKNGSAKKVGFDLHEDMGYVVSKQKFKIVFMDQLEVLPVRFTFFDPFQERVVELETEPIIITPEGENKKIKTSSLSEDERIQLYIEKFQQLYPEYFSKTSLFTGMFDYIYRFRNHLVLLLILAILTGVAFTKRVISNYIPEEIRKIASLKLERIDDLKGLFKYIYDNRELSSRYLSFLEKVFFGSEIISRAGKLQVIITKEGQISPGEIEKEFNMFKDAVIDNKIGLLSSKKSKLVKTYLFVERNINGIFLLVLLLLITLFIQVMAGLFPQYSKNLTVFNIGVILIILGIYRLIKKPDIKVKDG